MSKNAMTMNKTQIAAAFAASAVLALAMFFVATPAVHADDWSSGGDYTSGGFCGSCGFGGDTGGWTSGGDYTSPGYCDTCSLGGSTGGWTSGGDYTSTGYCDTCSYSSGYMPSYSGYGGGYSTGGYSYGGGWSFPYSSLGGGYSGGGSSNSNTNVNQNYCTNGSCNTAINAPTTVVTNNPAPQTVVYAQPSYPIYNTPVYIPSGPTPYDICPNIAGIQASLPTGYYMQNGNCFYNATPVAQPYVTLAAVPYTGLDLGPVGTALYWGFLVLWCLIAAYLIAVKKVQNNIAAWFTGRSVETTEVVAHAAPAAHAPVAHSAAPIVVQFDGIDPFIQSQINRTK